MTKNQFKKALERGSIVIVGVKYTKMGWTGFKVYEIKGNRMERIDPYTSKNLASVGYWNEKGGYYKCNAWGTDRRLEIIINIGYTLGLKFSEIRQNYQWLQDTF
jgi:hypothetical protein